MSAIQHHKALWRKKMKQPKASETTKRNNMKQAKQQRTRLPIHQTVSKS